MSKWLKNHYLALTLAIILGLATGLPQIIAIKNASPDFAGIYPISTADDIYYLARAKDIIDGHNFLSNPYLYEHKDGSPMQFWLPDYLLAKPLGLFGVSVPAGWVAYDFIWPAVGALLSYSIFYILTRKKILSLSATIFLHLGVFFDLFSRTPSPQFNFIFWLLLALCLFKFIKTKNKQYAILASIIFGLLFHLYTYYWTFYVVLFFVFIVLGLLFNRRFNFKPYIYILLGALVIAIPYFVSLFTSMRLDYYQESIYRLGMIDTRFPSGIKIVVAGTVAILAWLIFYKNKIIKPSKTAVLLLAGALACIICVNQHIITGKNLEFSSHYWPLSAFWLVFVSAYLLAKLNKRKLNYLILLLVIVLAVYKAVPQMLGDARLQDYEIGWQNYALVFTWLKQNTPPESVVYANNDFSQMAAIYTDNNVFYTRAANFHFMPDQEVYERFIINNYHADFSREFVMDNIRSIWGAHYYDQYGHDISKNKIKKLFGLKTEELHLLPDEVYNNFVNLKDELLKSSWQELLKKYRTDFIVWDKNNDPEWDLAQYDFLTEIYSHDNLSVYKINEPK